MIRRAFRRWRVRRWVRKHTVTVISTPWQKDLLWHRIEGKRS